MSRTLAKSPHHAARFGAVAATTIVAEIGVDMRRFASAKHLASWAGVCPGNNQSAGRRGSSKPTGGTPWLKGVLGEVAWREFPREARVNRQRPGRGDIYHGAVYCRGPKVMVQRTRSPEPPWISERTRTPATRPPSSDDLRLPHATHAVAPTNGMRAELRLGCQDDKRSLAGPAVGGVTKSALVPAL